MVDKRAVKAYTDKIHKISVSDIVLCAAIIFFSTAAVFRPFTGHSDTLSIYNGNSISECPLNSDSEIQAGNTLIIIKDGRAMIAESTCGHKICKNTGWLSKPGDVSACVPNRVMIEIKGGKKDYDAVSR